MRNRAVIFGFVGLFTGVLFSGCNSAEQSAIVPVQAAVKTANEETTEAETPAVVEPKKAEPKQSAYKPPFPERRDFFSPPERSEGLVAVSVDGMESTVELMGFVNVGTPHVVLAINGVVTPISQGVESHGVEVISIQPPRAVLQRGRTRWTAKLK